MDEVILIRVSAAVGVAAVYGYGKCWQTKFNLIPYLFRKFRKSY